MKEYNSSFSLSANFIEANFTHQELKALMFDFASWFALSYIKPLGVSFSTCSLYIKTSYTRCPILLKTLFLICVVYSQSHEFLFCICKHFVVFFSSKLKSLQLTQHLFSLIKYVRVNSVCS